MTYGAGLLRFNQFCDRFQIPETKRMPASYVLLSSFIADHSGSTSGATIRNWLNGLRLWHVINGAEWHGKHSWVAALIKTAEKEGIVFRRPPRNPITLDYLRALRNHLDLSKPLHAAIWASAVIAFWACRRLGELFPKSNSLFNPTTDTSRACRLSFYSVNGRRVISFHITSTKTTGIRGFDCIVTATGDEFCPVWAFENHLDVNRVMSSDSRSLIPLFAYREDGEWIPLTKIGFLTITSNIFTAAGLESVHGHSYRIGGTLRLLLDGVSPEVIMKIGGWTSLCFLIYWRRLEQVIPLAITQTWDSKVKEFARKFRLANDVHDNMLN